MLFFKSKKNVVADVDNNENTTTNPASSKKEEKKLDRETKRAKKAAVKEARALEALAKYAGGTAKYCEKAEKITDKKLVKIEMKYPGTLDPELREALGIMDIDAIAEELATLLLTGDDDSDDVEAVEEADDFEDVSDEDSTDVSVDDDNVDDSEIVDEDGDDEEVPEEIEDDEEIDTANGEEADHSETVEEADNADEIAPEDEEKSDDKKDEITGAVEVTEDDLIQEESDDTNITQVEPLIRSDIGVKELAKFTSNLVECKERTYEAISEHVKTYLFANGYTVTTNDESISSVIGRYRIGVGHDVVTLDGAKYRDVAVSITGINLPVRKAYSNDAKVAASIAALGIHVSRIGSIEVIDNSHGIMSAQAVLGDFPFDVVTRTTNIKNKKTNLQNRFVSIVELHFITKIDE